jgi:hypothetical protein
VEECQNDGISDYKRLAFVQFDRELLTAEDAEFRAEIAEKQKVGRTPPRSSHVQEE